MNTNKPTVIFIGGTSRSGSTLMDVILGHDLSGIALGDIYAHFMPVTDYPYKSLCGCGRNPCTVREEIKAMGDENLHARLIEDFNLKIISDSSKTYDWMYRKNKELEGTDIRTVNILMYKTPVSLAHSFFKRGKSIQEWQKHYTYYENFAALGLPYVTVNYNAFVANLPQSLELLCTRIEIPYFESKESFWKKPSHHFYGSPSVRELLKSENPSIRSTEEYSADFDPQIPKIEAAIRGSEKLKHIIENLSERDILLNNKPYQDLATAPQYRLFDHSLISIIKYPWKLKIHFPALYKVYRKLLTGKYRP